MIYAYIRVSTEKQAVENQRYEIYQFLDQKKLLVDQWIEETISSTRKLKERKLGQLLNELNEDDIIICTELSRIGRSLMEVMSILNILMDKKVKVFATKENYELGDNLNSHVLAFAFSLAAQIERNMISARTREALKRKKAEGKKLGRPKGSFSKSMLDGKEDQIREFLSKKVSVASIAKIIEVNRKTLDHFIRSRNLKSS